jgi:hypothetical protein
MRPVIYIAGPITGGSRSDNLGNALRMMKSLIDRGYAPICPHLSMMVPFDDQVPYETWLEIDFAWIKKCDGLFRIVGISPGADREVIFAEENGIPVFHHVHELEATFPCPSRN